MWSTDRDTHLVGGLAGATTAITVELDNQRKQTVTPPAKNFRFDRIARGTHELTLRGAKNHPFAIRTSADAPGDNFIEIPLEITPINEPPPEQNKTFRTVALYSSVDGSEPYLAAHVVSTYEGEVGTPIHKGLAAVSLRSGWVHLGKADAQGLHSTAFASTRRLPPLGSLISTTQPVVLRAAAPTRHFLVPSYELGSVQAVIPAGTTVEVIESKQAGEEGMFWARIGVPNHNK